MEATSRSWPIAAALIETNGLVVDTELVLRSGTAERDAMLQMAGRIGGDQLVTVGADKGYDTRGFVQEMRHRNVTPHVSQNTNGPGGSAIDGRMIRHARYPVSQRKRKRIEEVFGWLKMVGMLRKTRHRGVFKVGWVFTFAAARLQFGADEEPAARSSLRINAHDKVVGQDREGSPSIFFSILLNVKNGFLQVLAAPVFYSSEFGRHRSQNERMQRLKSNLTLAYKRVVWTQ